MKSRPEEITVRIDPLVAPVPGFVIGAEKGHRDLRSVTLSRHPENQDQYGCQASFGTTSQMVIAGLIEYLRQNRIEHVITKRRSQQYQIEFVSTVEVKGTKALDALMALAEHNAGASNRMSKRESGPQSR